MTLPKRSQTILFDVIARAGRKRVQVERLAADTDIHDKKPLDIMIGKGVKLGDIEQSKVPPLLSLGPPVTRWRNCWPHLT